MEVVRLDPVELAVANYAGAMLHHVSRQAGLVDRKKDHNSSSLEIDIVGQIAERVAAKALDLYWSSAQGTFAKPDLSHQIEVRAVRKRTNGAVVKPRDADSKRLLVVFIEKGREASGLYEVWGWLPIADAKRVGYYDKQRQIWWVNRRHLLPLHSLRTIINLERAGTVAAMGGTGRPDA